MIDAFCRAQGISFFEMLRSGKSGIDPGAVHPELKNFPLARILPAAPRTRFWIRHTVGLNDPISDGDLTNRVDDGEPETLDEYVKRDGLRFFKVKISGEADADLDRLESIWSQALIRAEQPAVTLDGNESYTDINEFSDFVTRFEEESDRPVSTHPLHRATPDPGPDPRYRDGTGDRRDRPPQTARDRRGRRFA